MYKGLSRRAREDVNISCDAFLMEFFEERDTLASEKFLGSVRGSAKLMKKQWAEIKKKPLIEQDYQELFSQIAFKVLTQESFFE